MVPRRPLRMAVGVIAGVALVVVALRIRAEGRSTRGVLDVIAHVSVPWLVAAVAAESVSYAAPCVVLHRLCRPAGLGAGAASRIVLAAVGAGALLPAQPLPGGALAIAELRRRRVPPRTATIATAITIVAVPAASMVFLAGPTLLASGLAAPLPAGWHETVLAAGSAASLLALVVVAILAGGRVRARVPTRLAAPALVEAAGGSGGAAVLVALGLLAWMADATCLAATAEALHVGLPAAAFPAAYVTGAIIAALPILPGGLGGVEVSVPLALAAGGTRYGDAVLVVLAWRVLSFWVPTAAGLAALASLALERRRQPS